MLDPYQLFGYNHRVLMFKPIGCTQTQPGLLNQLYNLWVSVIERYIASWIFCRQGPRVQVRSFNNSSAETGKLCPDCLHISAHKLGYPVPQNGWCFEGKYHSDDLGGTPMYGNLLWLSRHLHNIASLLMKLFDSICITNTLDLLQWIPAFGPQGDHHFSLR